MITYAATLDIPRPVVDHLARLLAAHRRRIGTPKGSRALGCFRQAVLVLRWFPERGCVHCLARDAGICQATGYRYLHEGIDVLAERAPDLHEVLRRCHDEGIGHVILDGTLSPVIGSPGSAPPATTCDTPGNTTCSAATSRFWPLPTAPHCGSPRSSLARSTTWPPPAPTLCPPCTGPPPSCTCPPGRRRLPRRRSRRPHPGHQTRRPPLPRPPPRQPHLQPAPARPTRPRRTRGRRTHPTLAHPRPHHPQPQPHRRHRPRHSRPQQQLEIETAEKTSVRQFAL